MIGNTLKLIPERLKQLHPPPEKLHVQGEIADLFDRPSVAVIGSRKPSAYGQQVTQDLAGRLAELGIVIISGLALGIDALAHASALDAGGLTIAVLPGPLEKIAPATNYRLARRITENRGLLVTEYEPGTKVYPQNFIARNRLIAGLADAVLITEAAAKSGSLHTARFALETGREVLAVPGDITRSTSIGTNNLIKAGATPVTSVEDILHVLGIEESASQQSLVIGDNEQEQLIIDLLVRGGRDGNELHESSGLGASEFSRALTMLEISGKIRALGGNKWGLR